MMIRCRAGNSVVGDRCSVRDRQCCWSGCINAAEPALRIGCRRQTECYDPGRDTWTLEETLPCDMPFAGSVVAGGMWGVVAVGGATWKTSVCYLGWLKDIGCNITSTGWQQRSAMQVPRLHSAMASLWDVYVMVGLSLPL